MSEKRYPRSFEYTGWVILWRATPTYDPNTHLIFKEGYHCALFRTRREARVWANETYGYIRTRKDLRVEPHCWHMPGAVRVTMRATIATE